MSIFKRRKRERVGQTFSSQKKGNCVTGRRSLANTTVGIILQFTSISNPYITCLKLTQCYEPIISQ